MTIHHAAASVLWAAECEGSPDVKPLWAQDDLTIVQYKRYSSAVLGVVAEEIEARASDIRSAYGLVPSVEVLELLAADLRSTP